jgi:hypothetical protein
MTTRSKLLVRLIANDFALSDLSNAAWDLAEETMVGTYWSGENAPAGRHFFAHTLWSDRFLYVRFGANQTEPLIVSETPIFETKTMNLWNRDVCEIFVAPDRNDLNRYFEFEVAPTGEWIDLAIDLTSGERKTDWEFESGMESTAEIENGRVVMAIRIPWKALGKTPEIGDVWLGNLFRCVGADPSRGYLAWQATGTEVPNFHVPGRFGEFEFVK